MRVLVVLIAAGFGWLLMGVGWARAKLSPGSVHDYDQRIRKAEHDLLPHNSSSDEYKWRKEALDRLVAEREAKFGKKDGIY